jgi:hypothetical protein
VPEHLRQIASAAPENVEIASVGSRFNCSWKRKPCLPRRMSVWPVAIQTRHPEGIAITIAAPSGSPKSEPSTRRYNSEPAPPSRRQRSIRARKRAAVREDAATAPSISTGAKPETSAAFPRFPPPAIDSAPRNFRNDRAGLRDLPQNPRTVLIAAPSTLVLRDQCHSTHALQLASLLKPT